MYIHARHVCDLCHLEETAVVFNTYRLISHNGAFNCMY